MTPTARTLKYLKRNHVTCCVAEYCVRHTFHTRDLFGFIDIVALEARGIVGIQVTTVANSSTRRKKILGECRHQAEQWLLAGGLVEVWGWKKYAKTGEWEPRIREITLADFAI